MRLLSLRLPHLIALLTLVFSALVPVAEPASAQQSLPAEFVGQWQGTLVQSNPDSTYDVTIDLSGGAIGAGVGTSAYSILGCRANLILTYVSGATVEVQEDITGGDAACVSGGTIAFTAQSGGSLTYEWSHAGSAATVSGYAWCDQLVTIYATAPPLSGPWRGPLEQRQGFLTRADGDVSVTDFVATAVVYNPATSSTVPWDFGYAFRQTADESEVQQIFVDSNGTWYYATYPDGVQASGEAPSYNFSPGDSNTLDLVVSGNTASFCLNGQFVSTVQLPPAVASDVYLVTGFFDETLVTGRLLEYERFAIWPVASASVQAVP